MLVEDIRLKFGTDFYKPFIVNAKFRSKTIVHNNDSKLVLVLFIEVNTDLANNRSIKHRGNYYHFTSNHQTTIYLDYSTFDRVTHNYSGFFTGFYLMNESGSGISSQRMEDNFKNWLLGEYAEIITDEVIKGALQEWVDSKISVIEEKEADTLKILKAIQKDLNNLKETAKKKGLTVKTIDCDNPTIVEPILVEN